MKTLLGMGSRRAFGKGLCPCGTWIRDTQIWWSAKKKLSVSVWWFARRKFLTFFNSWHFSHFLVMSIRVSILFSLQSPWPPLPHGFSTETHPGFDLAYPTRPLWTVPWGHLLGQGVLHSLTRFSRWESQCWCRACEGAANDRRSLTWCQGTSGTKPPGNIVSEAENAEAISHLQLNDKVTLLRS